MKILLAIIVGLCLIGCNENNNTEIKSKDLEQAISALTNNNTNLNFDTQTLEDAKALITRAKMANYKLVDGDFVKKNINDATIISTFESENKIPNTKVFIFAKSISINDNGSFWNWENDSLNKNIDDFKKILGDDKNKLIIFYDNGKDIYSPAGSAHTGASWASHLGYTNISRVIKGLDSWEKK